MRTSIVAVVAGVLLLATPGLADTLELIAIRDNTLYENVDGELSNGEGWHLFIGRTDQPAGDSIRRALLAFDVAGAVPAGSTITSATLRLNMSKTISAAEIATVHRMLVDWGEGISDASGQEGGGALAAIDDATWKHAKYSDTLWATLGGDFDPAALVSLAVNDVGVYDFSSAALASATQGWLDDGASNHGVIVIGEETIDGTAKRFDSRDHPTEDRRPRLIIEYTLPACTGDADADNLVGVTDFLLVLADWGPCIGCPADSNGDDLVGIVDFLAVLANWGPCP